MTGVTNMAYTEARGCDDVLNAWCDANCPHASEHGPLLARLDASANDHAVVKWRCYAPPTLDAGGMRYARGTTYCTRDSQLRAVLAGCLKATPASAESSTADVTVVGVSSSGATDDVIPLTEPVRTPDGVHVARVGVVVAHCHEHMHWLGEVLQGLREGTSAGSVPVALHIELHIFEKCNNRSKDAWPRIGWQQERRTYLENKGEECYAYLTYLTETYHSLPAAVLFFQVRSPRSPMLTPPALSPKSYPCLISQPVSHLVFRPSPPSSSAYHFLVQGDGVLNGRGFRAKARSFSRTVFSQGGLGGIWQEGIWRSVNDHQYISIAASASACESSGLRNCLTTTHNSRLFECAAAKYATLTGLPEPEYFAVYANAQFGVTRDRILSRSLGYPRQIPRTILPHPAPASPI